MSKQSKTGFEGVDPNRPESLVQAIPNIATGEYGLAAGLILAYGAYWCWKEFVKGESPIKGSSYWAKPEHLKRARDLVLQQAASKDPTELSYMLGNVPLYDVITSILTFGAPKSGKSFGILNQAIYEHLKKGYPQVIVDLQYPVQTSMFVAVAQELGYKAKDIHLFVPGEKESGIWNICESAVGSKALEMASMLQANFSSKDAKADDFFTPAGRQLIGAVLSMARHIPGMDNVLGCRALLNFDDLPDRLREQRDKLEQIDPWAFSRFDQYLASSKSDETASSIAGTAQNLFGQFCDEEIVPSLIGKTSFPMHMEGKQLLIIGASPRLRKTVSPLLMALLSQIVETNAHQGRQTPLQIAIDELPLVNYPRLITDINEIRKYGVFFNLAAQTLSQMRSQLGEHDTESLLTGAGTKSWFNTRSNVTAQYLETSLGSQKYRETNTTTGSSGGKGSTSSSRQVRERKMLTVAQIVKLPQGVMVLQNRGISSKSEEYIPWKVKTKPNPTYMSMIKWAGKQWTHTQSQLGKFSPQQPPDSSLLKSTRETAEILLPTPRTPGQKEADEIVRREQAELAKQLF